MTLLSLFFLISDERNKIKPALFSVAFSALGEFGNAFLIVVLYHINFVSKQ